MKRFAMAAMAAACTAVAAQAADPFEVAYGNTVTQTLPDGSKAIVYVNADKTWERRVGQQVVKGTYEWKDATHACFTITDPVIQNPAEATGCSEFKGEHKLGDTWTEQTPQGPITVAITAGR